MTKTLAEMSAEVRTNNISKGWRTPEGYETRSFPEGLALIHSEISEALEAYRDHGLTDATDARECFDAGPDMCATHHRHISHCALPAKPEGVGSELADVLIRLLDVSDGHDVKLFDMDMELADVSTLPDPAWADDSLGDYLTWLHWTTSRALVGYLAAARDALAETLRALVTVAERFGIDLMAEYERKIAYNRTRPFRHGGRAL